jgi:hypothetical protein
MTLRACAALAILMSTPALADPPASLTDDGRTQEKFGAFATDPLQARLDTCQQLLERAFYLNDPASLERAVDARREMELARDAFHQGDGFACTRHAIHALADRI